LETMPMKGWQPTVLRAPSYRRPFFNLTDFLHHVSFNLNMSLVAHSLKKNPYPISIFHFSHEYPGEIFQRTALHYYLITRANLLVNSDEAIFFYIGLNERDDRFIDWGWALAETDHAANTPGETDLMVKLVDLELDENVTRKQWFGHIGWGSYKLIIATLSNFRIEYWHSQHLQVTARSVFLFCVCVDHIPAVYIFNYGFVHYWALPHGFTANNEINLASYRMLSQQYF
jgi:hypothetical protein